MIINTSNCRIEAHGQKYIVKIYLTNDDYIHSRAVLLTEALSIRDCLVSKRTESKKVTVMEEIKKDADYYRIIVKLEVSEDRLEDFHSAKLNLANAMKLRDVLVDNIYRT